jgi:hypothetical protein
MKPLIVFIRAVGLVILSAIAGPSLIMGIATIRASQCGDWEALVSPEYWRGLHGQTAGSYDYPNALLASWVA